MRWSMICISALLSGCSIFGAFADTDPLEGRYWAETDDGWPALCIPGEPERCFQLSPEDKDYFRLKITEQPDVGRPNP